MVVRADQMAQVVWVATAVVVVRVPIAALAAVVVPVVMAVLAVPVAMAAQEGVVAKVVWALADRLVLAVMDLMEKKARTA
jgi:hypothetical protein